MTARPISLDGHPPDFPRAAKAHLPLTRPHIRTVSRANAVSRPIRSPALCQEFLQIARLSQSGRLRRYARVAALKSPATAIGRCPKKFRRDGYRSFSPLFSISLASFHSASICPSVMSRSERPCCSARSSICVKRRMNLRLLFSSAASGSTPYKRAALTSAKNRSPNSSSAREESLRSISRCTSAVSSLTFYHTSSRVSQSNPAAAAISPIR